MYGRIINVLCAGVVVVFGCGRMTMLVRGWAVVMIRVIVSDVLMYVQRRPHRRRRDQALNEQTCHEPAHVDSLLPPWQDSHLEALFSRARTSARQAELLALRASYGQGALSASLPVTALKNVLDFVENRRIVDRRRNRVRVSVGNRTDRAAQDFPRSGLWKTLDDGCLFEGSNRANAVADHGDDLADDVRWIASHTVLEHEKPEGNLSLQRIVHAHDSALGDVRM